MRIYTLIVILALFLQGCSIRETQPMAPIDSDQVSETNSALDETDSQKANQTVPGYFEQDGCQFVQKGFHLIEMFRDTGIDITEIIEVFEGFDDLHLYQREFPVGFYIDSNMPQELIEPIYEVVSEWNTEAGFEFFTIEGIYDNSNIVTSRDQVDETDQKNVIYWVMPTDSIFGSAIEVALGRVLPSPIRSVEDSNRLPFNETNIFIKRHSILQFVQGESIQNQMEGLSSLSEMTQRFGIQWPSNYLQDFESFQQAKQELLDFFRNASAEQLLEFSIEVIEIEVERLRSLINSSNDDDMKEYFSQQIEILSRISPEEIRAIDISNRQQQMVSNLFTRFLFELFVDSNKIIVYFKNLLKHEIGHTLGLANLYENDVNITDQVPLMWYSIAGGVDVDNPESYFDNPLEVDRYTLHALSCNYDLEALREQAQQSQND